MLYASTEYITAEANRHNIFQNSVLFPLNMFESVKTASIQNGGTWQD